jgi:hypothetical protein
MALINLIFYVLFICTVSFAMPVNSEPVTASASCRGLIGDIRADDFNLAAEIDGNSPIGEKISILVQKEYFTAKFNDDLIVAQSASAAKGVFLKIAKKLYSMGTNPEGVEKAIALAHAEPSRLDRYFDLHPQLPRTNKPIAFKHGFEVFYVEVNGKSAYVTSYLPSETDGRDVFGQIEKLKPHGNGKVTAVSLLHFHPEGHPLSVSDQQFADYLAQKYGLIVEMGATAYINGQHYILKTVGMPRDMSTLIENPETAKP